MVVMPLTLVVILIAICRRMPGWGWGERPANDNGARMARSWPSGCL